MYCNKNLKARNALLKSTNIRIWESRKIFKILDLIKSNWKNLQQTDIKIYKNSNVLEQRFRLKSG